MNPCDVVVLGAGISGLTFAHRAKKLGLSVQILEKTPRVGGVIQTHHKDGFWLEKGPNTVQLNAPLQDLITDLKIAEEVLLADIKTPRYILADSRLHPVPLSPSSFFRSDLLSLCGKFRLLGEPLIPKFDGPEESLYSFSERRLGKEVADRLIAPFISGVWAGEAKTLSAQSSFPKLAAWEAQHGSLLKGMIKSKRKAPPHRPKGLLSFKQGLEFLPQKIGETLKEDIVYSTTVEQIEEKPWRLKTNHGEFQARALYLATPAYQSARLIEDLDARSAEALTAIPYVPLITVHLAIATSDIHHDLHGFGYLVAPSEKSSLLGCLWNSSLFAGKSPHGTTLLTVFMGGATHPRFISKPDDELIELALTNLTKTLPMRRKPDVVSIHRIARAIPQYTLGHSARVKTLKEFELNHPDFYFGGNIIGGIAVGDVIESSVNLVPKLLRGQG